MISTIIIRCINLQYIENKNYSNKIEKREIREQNIKASRGIISDRNKNILADSILLDTLEVNDPKLFLSKNSKEKIQELCKVINKKCSSIIANIENKKEKKSIYLKRQIVSLKEIKKIHELNLKGIGFKKNPKDFIRKARLLRLW